MSETMVLEFNKVRYEISNPEIQAKIEGYIHRENKKVNGTSGSKKIHRWTADELMTLKNLLAEGKSHAEIAARLGMRKQQIYCQAWKIKEQIKKDLEATPATYKL